MRIREFFNSLTSSFPRKRESIASDSEHMSQQHFYLNRRWTHALAIARRWIPAFAGMTIFFAVEFILFRYIDRPLAAYTHSLDQTSPALIHFFRAITDLGKSIWYLVPCGLATLFCAFLSRGKDVRPVYRRLFSYIGARALFLFATIALSGIVCDILKPIMGRARPHLWLQNGIYGFDPFNRLGFLWNSMPSGHTTTACALAFSLSLLYPRGRFLWFAFALALAASRVMVDAHYLSDVCAGGLLGWLTVRLFFKHGMVRLGKVIFPIDTTPATE